MKTIEEKAHRHAIEAFRGFLKEEHCTAGKLRDAIERAYIAGAAEALAGQWRSVEDELPKEYDVVVVIFRCSDSPYTENAVAYWDGEDWYTMDDKHIRPTHWMSIPDPNKPESK